MKAKGISLEESDSKNPTFIDKIVNSLNRIQRESFTMKEVPRSEINQKKKIQVPRDAFKNFSYVRPENRHLFKNFMEDLASQFWFIFFCSKLIIFFVEKIS